MLDAILLQIIISLILLWHRSCFSKKTTYVGTLRKNKSDIPPEFQANKRRPVGSTLFGFEKDTTLVSYVPKKSKSVLLVSTMHHDDKIDEQTGKPDIILYYNHTKGAVDTVDQICHTYSVQRKTKRWPFAYFMNLINLCGLISYITYISRNPQWCQELSHKRRQFLEDLGLDLVKPLMERRGVSFVGLAKPIQQAMFVCGIATAATTTKMSKVQQNLRERDATDALLIESLLGSAQSVKKPLVLTILPKLKKSNVDLHASYRNYMWFSRNLRHLQEMQKTVGLWLNKNETI